MPEPQPKPKYKLDALIAEDLRLALMPQAESEKAPFKASLASFPPGKPPKELVERIIERVKRI